MSLYITPRDSVYLLIIIWAIDMRRISVDGVNKRVCMWLVLIFTTCSPCHQHYLIIFHEFFPSPYYIYRRKLPRGAFSMFENNYLHTPLYVCIYRFLFFNWYEFQLCSRVYLSIHHYNQMYRARSMVCESIMQSFNGWNIFNYLHTHNIHNIDLNISFINH